MDFGTAQYTVDITAVVRLWCGRTRIRRRGRRRGRCRYEADQSGWKTVEATERKGTSSLQPPHRACLLTVYTSPPPHKKIKKIKSKDFLPFFFARSI